jgi:hypothetical protein
LLRNTTLTKLMVAVGGALLTAAIGWAAHELSEISKNSTRVLEDIELFEQQQQEVSARVDRISERVDGLYQVVIERNIGDR